MPYSRLLSYKLILAIITIDLEAKSNPRIYCFNFIYIYILFFETFIKINTPQHYNTNVTWHCITLHYNTLHYTINFNTKVTIKKIGSEYTCYLVQRQSPLLIKFVHLIVLNYSLKIFSL